ncbi:MAG: phage portal protein [Enterocloster sp.]
MDDTALENYKNRLREDIHLGASVPNMTDEAFGGNRPGWRYPHVVGPGADMRHQGTEVQAGPAAED